MWKVHVFGCWRRTGFINIAYLECNHECWLICGHGELLKLSLVLEQEERQLVGRCSGQRWIDR